MLVVHENPPYWRNRCPWKKFLKSAPQKDDVEITALVRTPEKAEVAGAYGVEIIPGAF